MRQALTFYKFLAVADPESEQAHFLKFGQNCGVRGTILLAGEGVNGTLAGTRDELVQMQAELVSRFGEMPFKWSSLDPDNEGFYRFKVKLKPEIVSFGVDDLDVADNGEHVDVQTWNRLLDDPDVTVIDTRNQYEIDIGSFPGAISPETTNFRDFPDWVEAALDPEENRKIAMFCTGGIRCEKASAYMLAKGFSEVYQLDGGILKYLEEVEPESNHWQGECFVFDQRVSVNAELEQGSYQQCFACRHPVSEQDLASPLYEAGVQCPHCADAQLDSAQRQSFRERQKQVELAASRGRQHIGVTQESVRNSSR